MELISAESTNYIEKCLKEKSEIKFSTEKLVQACLSPSRMELGGVKHLPFLKYCTEMGNSKLK